MELLLILVPLLAVGLLFDGGGSEDETAPPPNGTDSTITRDTDAAA